MQSKKLLDRIGELENDNDALKCIVLGMFMGIVGVLVLEFYNSKTKTPSSPEGLDKGFWIS